MTVLHAVVLGIVQGITEFLPISSSGHLIALPALFGWELQGADFDVVTHLATLLAILWVLRAEVLHVLRYAFEREGLAVKIIVATIPAVIFGYIVKSGVIGGTRTALIVTINLMIWGVVLWLADVYADKRKKHIDDVQKTTWKQALLIGIAQAIAIIPGTSRSGITMTAGLFSGLDRKTAARFSFLLGIPAIAGAGVLVLKDAMEFGFSTSAPMLLIGFFSALVAGIFAIQWLLNVIERVSYKWFALYRIVLGVLLLLFVVV